MTNILGEDIRSVIHEVGEPCDVYNYTNNTISRDFIDFKRYLGTRIPFENEFQVLASFSYNSLSIPGDIINILSDNTYYILANTTSDYFEGEVITKESFMYKCNSVFQIQRKSETLIRDDNYQLVPKWDVIVTTTFGLLTGTLEHQHNMIDEVYARFEDKKRKFVVSSQLGIKSGDVVLIYPWVTDVSAVDFTLGTHETWQIELIEGHRLFGIKMCNLGEFTGI